MKLIPISQIPEENNQFADHQSAKIAADMTLEFYKSVGFIPPWIGYLVEEEGDLVGFAGFKGPPKNGTVEIAYGTEEIFRNQGKGTQICRLLVEMAQMTDSDIKITARTLPESNFSTKILEKNNFIFSGTVIDPEDGEVWEWVYMEV
jgi:RimJ/RimL family protein N-acetyltransferase